MGITSSLLQMMKDTNAISGAFSEFESVGTADMVSFQKVMADLSAKGEILVTAESDGKHTTWSVSKANIAITSQIVVGEGLRDTDNRSKAVQQTPWRVSLDALKRRVKSVEYIFPQAIPHMTIAVVMLDNGYALVGESAPADAENFNEQLGKEYAYENALRKMWPLEAYVMRDLLSGHVEVFDPNGRWN